MTKNLIKILALCMISVIILAGCGVDTEQSGADSEQTAQEGTDINDSSNDTAVFDLEEGTVKLNSGYTMPVIGLGTWTLSNDEAEESVYAALKCGMRLIDTARYYQCEQGVGRGLRRAIDDGIVKREDVFITSKIMPGDYDRAAQGINDSINDLGVDYVDLMLIHQPGSNDEAVYKAMEAAVKEGRIRSIGISNYYTKEQVDEVLSYAEIMPAVIQNENHLYYQNKALQEYVKQYGIVLESWYPFGGRGHTQDHFGNEEINELADIYGKTPAQIILRWHIQDGYITIEREFKDCYLSIEFQKGIRAVALPGDESRVAFTNGPEVLAGLCDAEYALYAEPEQAAETLLEPFNEREWGNWKQTFRTVGQDRTIEFTPLWRVGYDSYTVYFPIRRK